MKHLLLLFLFVSAQACAQQTTYTTTDNLFSISYAGYADGHYILSVKNNLTCTEHIKLTWSAGDSTAQVAGRTETQILLPAAVYQSGSQIRILTPDKCGGKNYETTIFYMPTLVALPLREPELATRRQLPKQYVAIVKDIGGNLVKKTTGASALEVASRLDPGLYIIQIKNTTQKILRL